ncbi:MAG: hypothetical protein KDC73_01045 [Ignavibacteriae bacterium]|nr:hypothetical protein [Ignavibacteriota bacterium]MCB9243106.1 hypothetical protein [Ignavibacteriales bacterium]
MKTTKIVIIERKLNIYNVNCIMNNTELILLLKSFNRTEITRLGEFVKSEYFNKLKNLVKLYDILYKHFPDFNIEKEDIFNEVFTGEEFDDARLRVLFSRMLSISKTFLGYELYKGDRLGVLLNESRAMYRKGQLKSFRKSIKDTDRTLNEQEVKDETGLYKMYELTLLKNSVKGNYGLTEEDLREEENLLLLNSILSLLRTYITLMNRASVLEFKDKTDRIEIIEPLISEFESHPLVKVYYSIYKLLKYPEKEELFSNCLRLLNESDRYFKSEDVFDLYVTLLNYCVLKTGNILFRKYKLTIYKTMIERGYLPREGMEFPYVYFNNIVNSAIESEEFDWGWEFLESNKGFLEPGMKDNIISLCEAKLYYGAKKYDEALNCLAKVSNPETDDVFYKLAIRDLQIKILFDMGHYESIYSAIDSYVHYLNRSRILNSSSKENYRLYLKYLKRLIDIITGNKNDVGDFRIDLEQEREFIFKNWIKEKAGKLA